MEINKNDEFTIYIDGYTSEGAGVGRIGSYPVFVPFTATGDMAKVRIVKVGKTFGYGKLIEIIKPSDVREEPICPHFSTCGGCAIMHLNKSERLRFKREKVSDALKRIGGIDAYVQDTVSDREEGYRNKSQMPVTDDYQQGMYRTHSNTKVAVPNCVIQDEASKRIIGKMLNLLKEKNIKPYDPETGEGVIRHLYTRVSGKDGSVLLIVVLAEEVDLSLVKKALEDENVKGLLLNINPGRTSVILGDKTEVIFGSDHIKDSLSGVDFDIYADSFFQVNRFLTQKLYDKAVELCGLTGKETVFDLYCGAGTITAALAKGGAGKVIGVEIVPSAVKAAKKSLARANIKNAVIYEGASEIIAPRLIQKGEKADVVVVDPPRKGCAPELLSALALMKPERIVYVSCDPATLARDAAQLKNSGYEVKTAVPFDMFPYTYHVETVVLMSRVKE
ncbi:MAG: 23S rRNA (uracil(1939)-C(5))-methyltransferase RlmD [Bacillota bacterium]|nr:23S rRNA (uracil(1939)-C(5))-methyltransferase RlmD [Bacillota bacterium]